MTTLAQIVAIEKSVKQKGKTEETAAYFAIQRTQPLSGIVKSYKPRDEEGDKLPSEETQVQVRVGDLLVDFGLALTRIFDVVLTKEYANTEAKADVKVGDQIILADMPVTYLLFLEKQLVDLHTFVSKLPILDTAETWVWDPSANAYATRPTETTRTKKVPKNWVKAEATDKHPAQVEVYHEDVIVGDWTTRKFSGAIPAERRKVLIDRVDALRQAVTFAREEANSREVEDQHAGAAVFSYLLAP